MDSHLKDITNCDSQLPGKLRPVSFLRETTGDGELSTERLPRAWPGRVKRYMELLTNLHRHHQTPFSRMISNFPLGVILQIYCYLMSFHCLHTVIHFLSQPPADGLLSSWGFKPNKDFLFLITRHLSHRVFFWIYTLKRWFGPTTLIFVDWREKVSS